MLNHYRVVIEAHAAPVYAVARTITDAYESIVRTFPKDRVLSIHDEGPVYETRTPTFSDRYTTFRYANRTRCESSNGFNHELHSWSISDWMTAVTGELGEAANLVKKLNRIRDKVPGNRPEETEASLLAELQDEIADVGIYLDLLSQRLGFDLVKAMIEKYNKTSEKHNMPYKIEIPK